MNLSPKYLINLLQQNGYHYKRASGSHQVYHNPVNNIRVLSPYMETGI